MKKIWVFFWAIILLVAFQGSGDINSVFSDCEASPKKARPKKTQESDEKYMAVIKKAIEDCGVQVESIRLPNGRPNGGTKALIISCVVRGKTQIRIGEEIGIIIGPLLGVAKKGMDIDEFCIILGDQAGNAIGVLTCKKEWLDDFKSGKKSLNEITLLILSTGELF